MKKKFFLIINLLMLAKLQAGSQNPLLPLRYPIKCYKQKGFIRKLSDVLESQTTSDVIKTSFIIGNVAGAMMDASIIGSIAARYPNIQTLESEHFLALGAAHSITAILTGWGTGAVLIGAKCCNSLGRKCLGIKEEKAH